MPSLKWTEEAIRAEAAKYDSKAAFQRNALGAYKAAHRRGMMDNLFKDQRRSWDEQSLRAEAAKYNSKVEFFRNNCGAVDAARKRFPGLLDELFDNLRSRWDDQSVRTESAKYESKSAFYRGNSGAYAAAIRLQIIDSLFENKIQYWDEQRIRDEAAKYESKKAFDNNGRGACNAARRLGILNELFQNKKKPVWTKLEIREAASKYDTKVAFQHGNTGAYLATIRRFPGLIDTLFDDHPKYTDGDAFYIWRVDGYEWLGHPVYKFGITSARLGLNRIHGCARLNRVKAVDIQLFQTDIAKEWEKLFLDMFTVIPDIGFENGKTELRACCPKAVQQLVESVQPKLLMAA